VDISLGPSLNAESLDETCWKGKHLLELKEKVTLFDVVDDDCYETGMQVGMDALVDGHDLDDLDDVETGIRDIY
jgi:hypothetical protein